jgi:ferritin-like metal-binding protein YciE
MAPPSQELEPPANPERFIPIQAVEHYEISRYGTLIAWAEELGLEDALVLLQETLEEEKSTDEALTDIAKTAINQQAEAA